MTWLAYLAFFLVIYYLATSKYAFNPESLLWRMK